VSAEAGLFDSRWDERSWRLPLHRGERVELSELTVHVIEITPDGRPLVCDFVFAQPLESRSYLWLTWRGEGLQPFHVPMLGQSALLSSS
jgi:hypothetical protein